MGMGGGFPVGMGGFGRGGFAQGGGFGGGFGGGCGGGFGHGQLLGGGVYSQQALPAVPMSTALVPAAAAAGGPGAQLALASGSGDSDNDSLMESQPMSAQQVAQAAAMYALQQMQGAIAQQSGTGRGGGRPLGSRNFRRVGGGHSGRAPGPNIGSNFGFDPTGGQGPWF